MCYHGDMSHHTPTPETPPNGDPLWPEAVAAPYIGRLPPTLRRWRCDGRGPAYYKVSPERQGRVMYRKSDLDAWLKARRVVPTAAAEAD